MADNSLYQWGGMQMPVSVSPYAGGGMLPSAPWTQQPPLLPTTLNLPPGIAPSELPPNFSPPVPAPAPAPTWQLQTAQMRAQAGLAAQTPPAPPVLGPGMLPPGEAVTRGMATMAQAAGRPMPQTTPLPPRGPNTSGIVASGAGKPMLVAVPQVPQAPAQAPPALGMVPSSPAGMPETEAERAIHWLPGGFPSAPISTMTNPATLARLDRERAAGITRGPAPIIAEEGSAPQVIAGGHYQGGGWGGGIMTPRDAQLILGSLQPRPSAQEAAGYQVLDIAGSRLKQDLANIHKRNLDEAMMSDLYKKATDRYLESTSKLVYPQLGTLAGMQGLRQGMVDPD